MGNLFAKPDQENSYVPGLENGTGKDNITAVINDIIGFLKDFVAKVMAILAKFESHFAFEEEGYND